MKNYEICLIFSPFLESIGSINLVHSGHDSTSKDALEGETIRLDCRFDPDLLDSNSNKLIFYWHRKNHLRTDPVAINENPLEIDYLIEYSTKDGIYDLIITKAQYDRDNGQFECKIKEAGNGAEVLSRSFTVTILSMLHYSD